MDYVVSDIHGCFYTLKKLVDKIHKQDESSKLIFVGDYIDRGLHSKQCIDFILQLQSEGAVCLRGNHDDVIDWMFNQESITNMNEMMPYGMAINLMNIGSWWISNGLFQTMESYLGFSNNSLESILNSFITEVPDEHKKFFRNLKMYWESETHFACHAFVNPKIPLPRTFNFLPESTNYDMLWSRFSGDLIRTTDGKTIGSGVNCSFPVWDKIGIFGHTPVSYYGAIAPIKYGKLRLIDTGAFAGEYMAAYCVEQDDFILQSTDSRDISKVV